MTNIITLQDSIRRELAPVWYRRASFGGVVHMVEKGPSDYTSICRITLGTAEQLEEGPYEPRCKQCQQRLTKACEAAMQEVPARVTTRHVVTITRNSGTEDPTKTIARRLAAMRSWEIKVEPLEEAT